ncbi:MAG TPA: dienelactone hydrolase family protein [Gammaproteobacteria bacterium]|nr:dienelactone hydrolase family protein [Gammaproteobacteria bacterium]
MKRVLFSALCGLLLAGPAIAQSAGEPQAGQADEHLEAMAREHAGDTPVAAAAAGTPAAGVSTETVQFGSGDGYLARPAGTPRAGLIVIHEWWGLNDNIREMARRLAAEGYLALAVDLYRGEVAENSGEARALMQALMEDESYAGLQLGAAFGWLKNEGAVEQVGSIGWCLGGGLALRLALDMPEALDAVVVYYGRLVTDPAELAPLRAPLLGIFGGQDQGIPLATVREFETRLEALGKEAEIVVYEEAGHAFANPSGTRYQPDAAADAWRRTLAFLDEQL